MKIKFEGNIETEVELDVVFKGFKQFMAENLQKYSFSMSNDKETLKDSFSRKEYEEMKKIEKAKAKEKEIKETKQGMLG